MSTVAEQPTLAGLPLPPAQAPAARPEGEAFKLAAVGRLLANAYVHTTEQHIVQLVALIEQHIEHHPQALPLLAVWRWPGQPELCFADAHARATARASVMPAGADVVVLGHGLETGTHHKQPVLRLLHCDGIDLAARVPTTFTQEP